MEIKETTQLSGNIQYSTPERPKQTLHSLQKDYKFECEMQDSQYHFSKNKILQIIEKLKSGSTQLQKDEEYFKYLCENLEEITQKYEVNTKKQIQYTDYKEKYKVHIRNEQLCYFREYEYIPIDTVAEYKEHFEVYPLEDEQKDNEIPDNRKGKSQFSCFSIDEGGNLYISPYKSDVMQHTYVTKGGDVLFAGTIKVDNGKICYVDNKSGHYRVGTEFMYVFFEILQKISQNGKLKLLFSEKFNMQKTDFSENMREIIERSEYGLNLTSHPDRNDHKSDEQLKQNRQQCLDLYK